MERYGSSSDISKLLRLTVQRVNQLAKEGIIKREEDGKFEVSKTLENYYKFKLELGKELSYVREHSLLEKAKREKAEIELEQLKGSLLYANDVEQLMSNMILTVKNRTLLIPEKCSPKILGQNNLPVIVEILRNEVYAVLNELSKIPSEKLDRQ